jgi:hypothetical protein
MRCAYLRLGDLTYGRTNRSDQNTDYHFMRNADIERNRGEKKNPNRAISFLVHNRNPQHLNGNAVEEKKI